MTEEDNVLVILWREEFEEFIAVSDTGDKFGVGEEKIRRDEIEPLSEEFENNL